EIPKLGLLAVPAEWVGRNVRCEGKAAQVERQEFRIQFDVVAAVEDRRPHAAACRYACRIGVISAVADDAELRHRTLAGPAEVGAVCVDCRGLGERGLRYEARARMLRAALAGLERHAVHNLEAAQRGPQATRVDPSAVLLTRQGDRIAQRLVGVGWERRVGIA